MKKLQLKYIDDYGEPKRVSVTQEIFTVGRHPENDLQISDSRLSREHIRIEQYNDTFYVSDSRSSNGTTLNGSPLSEAVPLKDGDRLNLGGAIEIRVEIAGAEREIAADETAYPAVDSPAPHYDSAAPVSINQPSSAVSGSGSIPMTFFWLAPIFGLIILTLVGGLFYFFSRDKENDTTQTLDFEITSSRTRTPRTADTPADTPAPRANQTPGDSSSSISPAPDSTNAPSVPKVSADVEKVEQNVTAFLRRIAQNDPRAFLTGKQSEIVNTKISQFKDSSALAENLKAIKKNAAQFETLANSKNLKAQFLATAALAKIGNNRGDPLAVAQTMLPILSDLKVTLDNKLADDNLLIIAAYERGAAGKPRSLQSTLEALSKQTQNVSPREIRSIWFLKDKGKITDAEFNFALQFLAIGAITQNPKDFNVNAEAVTFN